MVEYYTVLAVLALINLVIFLFSMDEKKLNYYCVMISLVFVLSNWGYLALTISGNLQEAILAKKVTYLGGCFLPLLILFVVCALCNFHIAKWLQMFLFMFSFAIYAMVLTIGYNDFYYTNISLDTIGNATVIVPEYGIGHTFFYVILYGYMVVEIIILVYSFIKKNTVSRKNLWALIVMEIITTIVFLVGRKISVKLEVMPLLWVIDGWILLYLHHRIRLYNVEDNIMSSLKKQQTYGYIMFDNRINYLGCNQMAAMIIPELRNCRVDGTISGKKELEFIREWLVDYEDGVKSELEFEKEDRHYECHIERIWHGEKALGYIIEIEDYTDKWRYLSLLSSYNSQLENQVKEKTERIRDIQAKTLLGMANMVENRDNNTGGHIKRTSDVIRILVETIQEQKIFSLSEEFCIDIIKAAPMHDLGKIGVDDSILRKPGRLTEEEFAIMQTHAEKSALLVESILKGVEEEHFVRVAMNVAKYHHEKWNGSGYPEHLKGDAIPLEARIMAIADVYDALVSKRCYKEAMSFEKAFQVMEESMGSHFDPQMEQVFLLSREKLEAYYRDAG